MDQIHKWLSFGDVSSYAIPGQNPSQRVYTDIQAESCQAVLKRRKRIQIEERENF